jgi:hypothetical protein
VAARLRFLLPAVLAAAVFSVPAANAGLISGLVDVVLPTCGTTVYPFAQFGDNNGYYALPNNGFESGATGWSLSGGAGVVSGNEPWYVNGRGASSLALRPGASATSPAVCINLLDPFFRMFAKSASANGNLQVQIIFRGLTGNLTGLLNFGSLSPSGYGSWQPSSTVPSLLALPLGTTSAQMRVTSTASSGTWQIDDVFVDPCVVRIG